MKSSSCLVSELGLDDLIIEIGVCVGRSQRVVSQRVTEALEPVG